MRLAATMPRGPWAVVEQQQSKDRLLPATVRRGEKSRKTMVIHQYLPEEFLFEETGSRRPVEHTCDAWRPVGGR
jgi:hypothetical protein